MGELHDDVYFGDINKRYSELAELSPENWNAKGKSDNGILKNYLKYTYKKLEEENKIVTEKEYSLFNTGLFTEYYEPIFAYMEKNEAGGPQPLYLRNFCTPYELGEMGICNLPDRANYFENPELLVFDAKCKINVQYKHILSDVNNVQRIPDKIKNEKNLQNILNGAIDMMKKKVSANYKIAVPQYFNGKIQLLLPLCLVDPDVPDMALVVTKNSAGNFYQGHTCLTLEMAYNNARLIAKPDSDWLHI
ncbi:MAG: DUF3825 domain-containing protein [Lachnospiraceae bacterium]